MSRKVAFLGVALCCLALALPSHADMFDDARARVNLQWGGSDSSGFSVRGGVSGLTGVPSSTTLFRATHQSGGGCGAFSFVDSFREQFEDLPEMLEDLAVGVGQNMPMLAICYLSPSLCDVIKHAQAFANIVVQARFAQCQQIQNVAMYGGARLRGGAEGQCLEEQLARGETIERAMRTCNNALPGLRGLTGQPSAEVNLVRDVLASYGVSEETLTLARSVFGEITLRVNNGRVSTSRERPGAALIGRYEALREEVDDILRSAVEELRDTGTVAEPTLRRLAVPGQPIPRVVIDGLVALEKNRPRYEVYVGQLATGLAIARLTWQCQELQETLAAAISGNQELTPEAQRLLEDELKDAQRQLLGLVAKKEIVEKHVQPAMQNILTEYAAIQQHSSEMVLQTPERLRPIMPFGTQNSMGYSQ